MIKNELIDNMILIENELLAIDISLISNNVEIINKRTKLNKEFLNLCNEIKNKKKNDKENDVFDRISILKMKITNLMKNFKDEKKDNSNNINKINENKYFLTKFQLNEFIKNNYFSYNEINYNNTDDYFIFHLKSLLFPPSNLFYHKAFIKIVDENLNELNLNDLGCIIDLKSSFYYNNFDFKITYSKNYFNKKNIFFIIFLSSIHILKKIIFKNPLIWGFSLIKINSGNNSIIEDKFKLPIYHTKHFLENRENFIENLKVYPHKNNFKRINNSFLVCSNQGLINFNKNKLMIKNLNFKLNKKEILFLKSLNLNNNLSHDKINDNFKLNIDNNDDKLQTKIDIYIQLYNSSISNYISYFNQPIEKINLYFEIECILNIKVNSGILIEVFVYKKMKNEYEINKLIIKEVDFFEVKNKILKLKKNIFILKEFQDHQDFLVIKVYLFDKFTLKKKYYGNCIAPLFLTNYSNINGKFSIPIIFNQIEIKAIEYLLHNSPWKLLNFISNDKNNKLIKFTNSILVLNIKNYDLKIVNDNNSIINWDSINNIFMPNFLFNTYKNINKIRVKKKKREIQI